MGKLVTTDTFLHITQMTNKELKHLQTIAVKYVHKFIRLPM